MGSRLALGGRVADAAASMHSLSPGLPWQTWSVGVFAAFSTFETGLVCAPQEPNSSVMRLAASYAAAAAAAAAAAVAAAAVAAAAAATAAAAAAC